jgi:putative alpha-1,2-mannosidase
MKYRYSSQPDGIPGTTLSDEMLRFEGNDDYGTMSAWYTFGALGFYPLAGSELYLIGSPIFPKITLARPQGNLTVIAHDANNDNIFVSKVTLNGKPIDMKNSPFLLHSQILGETVLEFWMTSKRPSY